MCIADRQLSSIRQLCKIVLLFLWRVANATVVFHCNIFSKAIPIVVVDAAVVAVGATVVVVGAAVVVVGDAVVMVAAAVVVVAAAVVVVGAAVVVVGGTVQIQKRDISLCTEISLLSQAYDNVFTK